MYLRLWAWLSYICQTLPNISLSHASLPHQLFSFNTKSSALPFITFYLLSNLPLIFPQIIAKTRRYELRLFFIQPNFWMHIHFCQSTENTFNFTTNFFFTTFSISTERLNTSDHDVGEPKKKQHRNHTHTHTLCIYNRQQIEYPLWRSNIDLSCF